GGADGGGTDDGRPGGAAADTPTIAPEGQPAGMPASPSVAAPTAPKAIVSAKRRANRSLRVAEADIQTQWFVAYDQCPAEFTASNAGQHRGHAFASHSAREWRSAAAAFAQHNTHQVSRIFGAEFLHDPRTMHLDGARADAKLAPGLLVGEAGGDLCEHI